MDNFKVPADLVDEFKALYIRESGMGVEDDEIFKKMLAMAYSYVVQQTAPFDIEQSQVGKQLVFDRAGYIRANASELFYQNYLPDLNAFGLTLRMEDETDDS